MGRFLPVLFGALLSFASAGASADECPTWSFSGTISSGDGSTIPGTVALWSTCCPAPNGYYGDHAPGTAIEISGGGAVGNSQSQWYALHGDYCVPPPSGDQTCTHPAGEPCGTCTGNFDIELFASQGALEGTVKVTPEPETLEGITVFISTTPDSSGTVATRVTDAEGHFEVRAPDEPARSNNWGLVLDCDNGQGSKTFYVGSGTSAVQAVTLTSSQLATVELELTDPRAGGGGEYGKRGGPSSGGGSGAPGCGGSGGGGNRGGGTGPGDGGAGSPPDAGGSCDSRGQPVNVQTGNVFFDQTDISVPGVLGLHFVRSYNSKDAYYNLPSNMSRGWSHSYSRRLVFADARSIDFWGDDGVPIYYQDLDGDDTYDAALPRTEKTRIVETGGEYQRTFPGGSYETYDSAGRLTSAVDTAGNTTTLERDLAGRVSRVTDPGGRALVLEYDTQGRLSSLFIGDEVVATYGYDTTAQGKLHTVSYPDGSGYVFVSDPAGQILRVEDNSGRPIESHAYGSGATAGYGITSEIGDGKEKLTFSYEAWQTTVTDALGSVTTYDWRWVAAVKRVTKITGPCASCGVGGEQSKEWTHDGDGRITARQKSGEGPTLYSWNAEGRLERVEDPLGRTTDYTYDAQGRVLTASVPGGGLVTYTYGPYGPLTVTQKITATTSRTTAYTYTALGQLHTVTDPRGKTTTYAYNSTGDLESVTDPLGHTTTFAYDSLGRRISVTDELGRTTTTTYDQRGRVTRVTGADDTHTDFLYDLAGRRIATTDALGRTSRSVYDPYGRLSEVVDPMQGVTRYAYDVQGRLVSLTDPGQQMTTFAYDDDGRMSQVTYPGGAYETFAYDLQGRLDTKTDRRGIVTTYAYDAIGRLTGKTYSDGTPAVTYTYDAAGRLATAANGSDTLGWEYDLAGQVTQESSTGNSSVVAYAYDLGGNRLSVSLDGQLFASYGYDDASRLTSITRGSNAFGFGYDDANRRTSMSYPNGITTTYAYDLLNRLTGIQAVLNGTTTITSFGYLYDAAGNRTRKQQLDYTEDYSYDSLYRLTGVERTAGLSGHWHFDYDAVGNRLTTQKDDSVSSASYDDRNQLLTTTGGGALRVKGSLDEPGTAKVNGDPARILSGNVFEATIQATTGTNTFSVEATDLSGNSTTTDYQVDVTATGASYDYDANGNLVEKTEGSDTWTYEWNAENQLKRVTRNGSEVARFSYDPLGRRVEKIADGITTSYTYDGEDVLREVSGATSFKYVHGPGVDEPLAREDASGALTYYHVDALGSVVRRTSQAGAVVHEYRYDAWGNIEAGASEPGYSFTGREWDPETALYYYRARYYDPKIGRFLSEDPIGLEGETPNLYAYVDGNPLARVDPTGMLVELYCVGIGQGPGAPLPNRAAGAAGMKHCFLRIKCECSASPPRVAYDYRLEVLGPNEEGNADIPAPQTFAPGGGTEASIQPPDNDSKDCKNEDCLLRMYRGARRRGRPYGTFGPNSNTFVRDLLAACGMTPNFPPGVIR